MSIMPHVGAGRRSVGENAADDAPRPPPRAAFVEEQNAESDDVWDDETSRSQQSRVVVPSHGIASIVRAPPQGLPQQQHPAPPGASVAAPIIPRRTGFDRDGFEARRPKVQPPQQYVGEPDTGLVDDEKADDYGNAAAAARAQPVQSAPPPPAARRIAVMPSARAALAKRQSSLPDAVPEPSPTPASAQHVAFQQPPVAVAPKRSKPQPPQQGAVLSPLGPRGVGVPLQQQPQQQRPLTGAAAVAAAAGIASVSLDEDGEDFDEYGNEEEEEDYEGAGGGGGGAWAPQGPKKPHSPAPHQMQRFRPPSSADEGGAGGMQRAPSAVSLSWGLGSGVFDSGGSRIKVRVGAWHAIYTLALMHSLLGTPFRSSYASGH